MSTGERSGAGPGGAGPSSAGAVVVDVRVLQSPGSRTALPAKLALELAGFLEERSPHLVGRYLLALEWPSPGDVTHLHALGKLSSAGAPGAIQPEARVYLSLFCGDIGVEMPKLWPAVVESEGLSFCAAVHGLDFGTESAAATEGDNKGARSVAEWRLGRAATFEALRHADALLATSEQAVLDLAKIGIDPARVTLVGPGTLDGSGGRLVAPAAEPASQGSDATSLSRETAWGGVVHVLEGLARRPRRPWRRPTRPRRLALISPFPPVPSGVAEYGARLAPALRAELRRRDPQAEMDCFADGRDRAPARPEVPAAGWYDARSFGGIDAARAGYDEVVYVLGNSEFHAGALTALRRRGEGIVMAHDVRMTNLFRYSGGSLDPDTDPQGDVVRRSPSSCPSEGWGQDNRVSAADEESGGLLLLREIAARASSVLVNSQAALHLAEVDVGPVLSRRLGVLPFAIALPETELTTVRTVAAGRHGRGRLRIASFGIVDPAKKLDVLLCAVAELLTAGKDIELFIVGPVSDAVSASLRGLAADLGVQERVHLTGMVDRESYLEHLGRADLAVQLRARDGGEASAAVGNCLAAGIPTVVSRLGWLGELPGHVVVKIPGRIGPPELAEVLSGLLGDERERRRLSARAAAWAAEQTTERAAGALLDVMGVH